MRITILFGGTNKERLVSVASAQALHQALPEADLWFWDVDDTVHEVRPQALLNHSRPFEDPFQPGNPGIGAIEDEGRDVHRKSSAKRKPPNIHRASDGKKLR